MAQDAAGVGVLCLPAPPAPLVPDIVTAESRGMIFFWTSSRGPGLRASFSFRSSASRARFSLSWASREEPWSAQHTAASHRQQGNTSPDILRRVFELCVDVRLSAASKFEYKKPPIFTDELTDH